MTTITITNLADLRAGDIATLSYEGHEFSGEVWAGAGGELFLGITIVHYNVGDPLPYLTLISATREVPDLPTEPGSVIANVVTESAERYDLAMLVGPTNYECWMVVNDKGYMWLLPEWIVSWDPCTVEVQA